MKSISPFHLRLSWGDLLQKYKATTSVAAASNYARRSYKPKMHTKSYFLFDICHDSPVLIAIHKGIFYPSIFLQLVYAFLRFVRLVPV